MICGLNACVNDEIDEDDIEEAIDFIKKNAKLTLSAELNFDRIMFSIDDISTTPFSLLKMLRIHNPEYYKENLAPIVAKIHASKLKDHRYIPMSLNMFYTIVGCLYDLNIYADFELTSDEITVTELLKALYSCVNNRISKDNVIRAIHKLQLNCNFSNAANKQLLEIQDDIESDHTSAYLIEMIKVHNPIKYLKEIETMNTVNKTGIDLTDNFELGSIKKKTYIVNGIVDWETLFNDISRCFVNVGNAKAFYIKDYIAETKSYQLTNYKTEIIKERLSDVLIKSDNVEKIKTFSLCELLFDKKFYDIRCDHQSVYEKRGVAFYSNDKDELSLFTGFKYPNIDNVNMDKISLFLDHVKNIIAVGRDDLYNYILAWVAFIIQNPGKKTETCLILLGEEGTGKSMFTSVICKLFGNYALNNISNIDDIAGKFNGSNENKMLIVLNEINATENTINKKSIQNSLKTLMTEDKININKNVLINMKQGMYQII